MQNILTQHDNYPKKLFSEVFSDDTKLCAKIAVSNYLLEGEYPIIDQSKNFIAGYSNSSLGIYADVPAIIFGDHTRIIKYVDKPFFIGADGVKLLKPKMDGISTKYLYYVLLHAKIPDTGYNRHFKWLKEIKIPLPPLDIQRQIADTLDKVTELIDLRKKQLEKLDELIKARFVEMFGDPVLNPKDWECKTVIDECDCMVPGRDKPKSFTGDIPWITIEDLAVNGVTYESKRGLGLTQEEIDEVNRKTIPKGSVIMSCVGNLGICSIAGKEMIINQQLHSFQCGERINNVFLMNYLGYRKDFMNKWASNTTVLYMNKSICNSIPVIIPPIELQEQFAAFVQQTDKSKVIIQQNLDALETLKKSLMQEYFG